MAVLRKANTHSVVMYKLKKKNQQCRPNKKYPRRKADSNFDFSQAA